MVARQCTSKDHWRPGKARSSQLQPSWGLNEAPHGRCTNVQLTGLHITAPGSGPAHTCLHAQIGKHTEHTLPPRLNMMTVVTDVSNHVELCVMRLYTM